MMRQSIIKRECILNYKETLLGVPEKVNVYLSSSFL